MTEEQKVSKKQYKKAKQKAIRPWKGLTITMMVLTGIVTAGYAIVSTFDNTVAAFLGGTFYKLNNEDESAQYFTSDFASNDAMKEKGEDVCYQVEAEGATLLMNNNNALPLAVGSKVSTFSSASLGLVYGGSGSGSVDTSNADTLKSALKKSKFEVNETLWDFYETGAGKAYVPDRSGGTVSLSAASILEAPWSAYDTETLNSVKNYGDAAIVTFARSGGEGADLIYDKSNNYLALNSDEKDMMSHLKAMKDEGTVKKIVVLINSANALQVDFLKNNEYDVDAVLWIGDVGNNGLKAVTDILCGAVNPSGKLVDTYCYDNYSSPAMQNFTPITYQGYEDGIIPSSADTYLVYQEDIYVGYKYYESRYYDKMMGLHNAGDYKYDEEVAYPFGFGLSYGDFEYTSISEPVKDDVNKCYNFTVTVKNNGTLPGKNTVEIYLQKPVTERKLEVSAVQLAGFAKSEEIPAGKSATVTVSVDYDELTTYDCYDAKTYVMDEGDYLFTVANGSHEAANNFLAYNGKTTDKSAISNAGNKDLVRKDTHTYDKETYSVSSTGVKITNQLSDGDINLYENGAQKVQYLSRYDWTNTFPTGKQSLKLTEQLIKDLQDVQYDAADYKDQNVTMPSLDKKNGINLYDLIGKSYDDPLWDNLLDELTFDEMVSLIGDAFHWTMPCTSVNAPGTRDENGPQGLTASLLGGSDSIVATAFTSEDVMAATYNRTLMSEVGNIIGNNCLASNVAILYGTGNNIHRTPYGGRNFEYYSEDGFLSGEICAAEVKEIENKGVHVAMKHFAFNDCEQDRLGLGVWLNEQSAREIYLKAFEAPFVKGNANGIMASYTRLGATWSGGSKGLITNILRKEWGSNGLFITDNVLVNYVNGVDGIMAGISIYDAMLPYVTNQLPKYKNDAVIVNAMREASHHDLYAIANSVGMNGVGKDTTVSKATPGLVSALRTLEIINIIALVAFAGLWIWRSVVFHKSEDYQTYKASKKKN